jgi:acyl-coenzyme A thioesterase PaaI-like protein
VYDNKPEIAKFQSYLKMMQNNYFITNMVVGFFRRTLMAKHVISHKMKEYKSPSVSSAVLTALDRFKCTETEAAVIHFAERTDTHIRRVLATSVVSVGRGRVTARQTYKPIFTGNFVTPCLHGGVTAALLEHCAQCCARTITGDQAVRTDNIRLDYLAPAPCFTDILADAAVVGAPVGSDSVWVDVTCWNHSRTVKIALGRVKISVI